MASLRARLEQHGLGRYAALFAEHGIDFDILPDLTDADLEKLGVPLGDRRRIMKAALVPATSIAGAAGTARDAERRQLTVMFADLVDSTKLASRLDPEDMKDVIAQYQKAVSQEVANFGGHVAKPLGDGLLIYFGWPQAHEDDAERAVRSALAAVAAVRRLATPDGTPLAARIGIATGEVVVGDFTGTGLDEAGAVVGGTPNLAARLQAVAGQNAVVIAAETQRLTGRQFSLADLGEQNLKGFDKPVRAWRVDGETTVESRFDARRGGRLGAFVGRQHEIGMLLQRWQDTRDGECQLVLIVGEAGIGKSRLVSEYVGRLEGEARRISYQASPLHSNTALYPVVRHLQAKAGFSGGDSGKERLRKLEACLPGDSPQRSLALKSLAELMSLDASASEAKASVEEQRDALFEVLADLAARESELAPLLVVVEDAHWLDATTQEFVERLLDRLQHRRAMVLVTYRPEFKPPWAQHANVGLLSMSRLGRRDARAIVDSLQINGQSLPPEVAEDIVAKGDGIPLFVEELTGSVLESARSADDRGLQIPATLRDALSERLDRLGSAKEVAQIAAAFGREFAADLVAATLPRSEAEIEGDLDRLKAIAVIFPVSRSSRRYTFHHALLQEAAYDSMLKSKRREVHGRIAAVLAQHRPEMAETEPEVLASHFARAGDAVRAAECWRKAGHLAQRNSAYREAIGAFKNALALLPAADHAARVDTNRAIASAYFASGDYASMRDYLEHAAADAEAAGEQVLLAEIAMQQGHVLNMYGGNLADAVQFGERALDIATRLNDEGLAYGARFTLGQSAWIGGNFATTIRFLTANLPENLRHPERVRDFGTAGSLLIDSLSILGSTLAHCGEFERSQAILDRATSVAATNAFDVSVALYHLNRARLQKGDASIALPSLIDAVKHATETGLRFTLPWHRALLGYANALLGAIDEGATLLQQSLDDTRAMHLPYTNALTGVYLAEILTPGRPERAAELAEAGLNVARTNGYRAQEAEFLRVKAGALAGNDPQEAEALAQQGIALAGEIGMQPEEGHAWRVLGDIAAAAGDDTAARQRYARARSIYGRLGMAYWFERMGATA